MRISLLTFGAIASIITTAAFADTTVTSKTYVDTTRQATIPTAGTNAATPGSTVVTYTSTAGTIGERGICNDPADNCNQADIATFGLVGNAVEYIQNNMPDFDDLPETTVTYKTCYQEVNGECILWNLTDKNVYGRQCQSMNDCECYENGQFAGLQRCENGRCTGECLMY